MHALGLTPLKVQVISLCRQGTAFSGQLLVDGFPGPVSQQSSLMPSISACLMTR